MLIFQGPTGDKGEPGDKVTFLTHWTTNSFCCFVCCQCLLPKFNVWNCYRGRDHAPIRPPCPRIFSWSKPFPCQIRDERWKGKWFPLLLQAGTRWTVPRPWSGNARSATVDRWVDESAEAISVGRMELTATLGNDMRFHINGDLCLLHGW